MGPSPHHLGKEPQFQLLLSASHQLVLLLLVLLVLLVLLLVLVLIVVGVKKEQERALPVAGCELEVFMITVFPSQMLARGRGNVETKLIGS